MGFRQKAEPVIRYAQVPAPAPAPEPAPAPAPVPTETVSERAEEARRKKIKMARQGILSTIKTSPLGILGAGIESGISRGSKVTLGA